MTHSEHRQGTSFYFAITAFEIFETLQQINRPK